MQEVAAWIPIVQCPEFVAEQAADEFDKWTRTWVGPCLLIGVILTPLGTFILNLESFLLKNFQIFTF